MAEPALDLRSLPDAPKSLGKEPPFGLYRGVVENARFGQLSDAPGPLARRTIEKRWQYVFVTTPDVMLTMAIVDLGYLGSGFCAVFDRGSKRLLVDSNPITAGPLASVSEEQNEGLKATLLAPFVRAKIEHSGAKIHVSADWANAKIDLQLDPSRAPAPMTAIAPIGPGRFDFTQKLVLVPAEGEIRAGNSRFAVQDQPAGLDYTHGLLARETAWRWAFGMQGRVGFNFSEGFLHGLGENVVWLDGEPHPVGAVRLSHEGADGPWRITGDSVDLTFLPEGQRAQTTDLRLIMSRFVSPFGAFSGRVLGVDVSGVPGVTEDHAARW